MATHSNILAWRNPVDRRAWRATVHGYIGKQSVGQDVHDPSPRGAYWLVVELHDRL